MWMYFHLPFRWQPMPSYVVSYPAKTRAMVTRACGKAALAAGVAVRCRNPKARKADG